MWFHIITWSLTFLSLLGAFLNARMDIRGFYIWIISNVGWIIINIYKEIYAGAALFIVYTAISAYGIYSWRIGGKDGTKSV